VYPILLLKNKLARKEEGEVDLSYTEGVFFDRFIGKIGFYFDYPAQHL